MNIIVNQTVAFSGKAAAEFGAAEIRKALQAKGAAHIIVATGSSQFEMLEHLVKQDLDWSKVTGFHLDEYLGLSIDHPASFRKYLKERFVSKVALREFHYVNGDSRSGDSKSGDSKSDDAKNGEDCVVSAEEECDRLEKLISKLEIDVAFIGIGENGHLAFNDPPADFETDRAYIKVELDKKCREQQLGEGWFPLLEAVPENAISMSVRQILKSKVIVCTVPDHRKSWAVKQAVEGPVSPELPASILQEHENVHLYLDIAAASQLQGNS